MTDDTTVPDPVAPALDPAGVIRAAGFDPDTVRAVVVTPWSVVAIADAYPEPYVPPAEVPDADH